MKPLIQDEIQEATALIANMPYDADVIQSVRLLLRKKAEERRNWQSFLKEHFPPHKGYAAFSGDSTSELDDTTPMKPIEFDGD